MDSGVLGQVELDTLLARTSLSVAACDAAGSMTFLSPALQEMFGRTHEGLHASEFVESFDLYDADGSCRLRAEDVPLSRALRGEVVKDALISARLENGDLVFLRCNAAPLRGPDEQLTGAVVLVQDVTSEQTAHREQEELRHRLLMTLNHEFRTPLTKLMGHAELLQEEQDPLLAGRSLYVVWKSAEELAGLMDTISTLLDLEAHTKLARTHTDVAELVRGIAGDFTGCDRGVRLVAEVPESLPATVDPVKTRKAIVELLTNAATYSPRDAEIRLRVSGDSTTVRVAVCDAGSGVPPQHRDRLLQPFERGDHPLQPVDGKGLGLAIARTVAVAHGGQLELTSADPRGLCATLLFSRAG
jgi:PAS domain S-box-containing protein